MVSAYFLVFTQIYVMDLVGYGEKDNPNINMQDFHHDVKRVDYMARYLDALLRAVR
jgi:hypothetical protein